MNTLNVFCKVPILTEPLIGAPALIFTHWLPLGEKQGITIEEENINLLLWFDLQSTWWASQPNEEELRKHSNVLAHYIKARIRIANLEDNLLAYIKNRDFTRKPDETEKALQNEYDSLGQHILGFLIDKVNRLIDYARIYKGQYWLVKYIYNPNRLCSYFTKFDSFAKINDGELFRFQPGVGDTIQITLTPEEKFISETEWDQVKSFVNGKNRPPLVLELLAEAEQLAGNGYRRSAIVEAITALEVAISDFGRSDELKRKFSPILSERIGIDNLNNQIERLGLSGTIGYLLPLIIPEEILPANILKECREALMQRQNVVHNGQRDVEPKKIHTAIINIRKFCEILMQQKKINANK